MTRVPLHQETIFQRFRCLITGLDGASLKGCPSWSPATGVGYSGLSASSHGDNGHWILSGPSTSAHRIQSAREVLSEVQEQMKSPMTSRTWARTSGIIAPGIQSGMIVHTKDINKRFGSCAVSSPEEFRKGTHEGVITRWKR